jgi:hypothetical protein
MITCPVCKGIKVSPFGNTNNPCLCCKGVGSITEKHHDICREISKDLAKRLREKEQIKIIELESVIREFLRNPIGRNKEKLADLIGTNILGEIK